MDQVGYTLIVQCGSDGNHSYGFISTFRFGLTGFGMAGI